MSTSLLAQVSSLNQQLQQQNLKIHSLLQTLLKNSKRSTSHLHEQLSKQKQQVVNHNKLYAGMTLKKSTSSSNSTSFHLTPMKRSRSTKRCQSCCKINSQREQNIKERCWSSRRQEGSKLKKLSAKMFSFHKGGIKDVMYKSRTSANMLRL